MNLNNIIKYLYVSYFVRNVVFYLFFILILMRLKVFLKFNLINYLTYRNQFLISFNKNNKKKNLYKRIHFL